MPWLAASGPLSYTPESPPPSDYYFQYSWILPDIFDPATNTRRHFYFGAHYKDDAKELLSFWNAAREGRADSVALHFGVVVDAMIEAPVAIYSVQDAGGRACYLFMQHGSYQFVPIDDQPLLSSGEVVLYRGIGRSRVFRFLRLGHSSVEAEGRRFWQSYVRAQSRMLSDSVLSFNSIHDRARRCETGHIRDGSWISDEIARAEGMDPTDDPLAAALWNAAHQSFSLARWVGENKFGPHFVTSEAIFSSAMRLILMWERSKAKHLCQSCSSSENSTHSGNRLLGRIRPFTTERCSVPVHREANLVEVDARGSDSLSPRLLIRIE